MRAWILHASRPSCSGPRAMRYEARFGINFPLLWSLIFGFFSCVTAIPKCHSRNRGASRGAPSEPAVVETDADSRRTRLIGRHFVAQPAFKEQHAAGFRRHHDPGTAAATAARLAWRRRHEAIEPWIFELETRTAA